MDLDRKIIRELRDLESRLLPPVGELGMVVFLAAGVFAVIAAAAEFLQPGFVVNFISARSIVAVAAAGGGLALLGRGLPEQRSRRQSLTYAGVGVLAAFTSFLAAWYYFQSVPEARLGLAAAAAAIVAGVFWVFSRNGGVPER